MIDPALMSDSITMYGIHAPTESIVTQNELVSDLAESPVTEDPVPVDENVVAVMEEDEEDVGNVQSPSTRPPSEENGNEIKAQLRIIVDANDGRALLNIPAHLRQSPDVDISYSPITVDGNIIASTERPGIKAEDSDTVCTGSRHSSRQPKQVERYNPEKSSSSFPSGQKADRNHRESSSSEPTLGTSVKSRRSSSNTSGMTHQVAALNAKIPSSQEAAARPVSRASSAGSDVDADEKFARELQAAENGLRRRASMRA